MRIFQAALCVVLACMFAWLSTDPEIPMPIISLWCAAAMLVVATCYIAMYAEGQ